MSTDMAINPWTIRASHAPLEVHASHFSTLRTSVNPTLDGPNPPPSTGWSQLSVISSFHHQKFQTQTGHIIIYRIKPFGFKKKNTIWDTWSEWNHQRWVTNDCSQSVTCILPGTTRNLGVPASPWNSLPSKGLENLRHLGWETKKYLGVQSYDRFISRQQLKVCPLATFFLLSPMCPTHFSDKDDKKQWPLWFAPDKRPKYCCSAFSCISPKTLKSNQKMPYEFHGWNPHTDGVTWTRFFFPIQENKRVIFSTIQSLGPTSNAPHTAVQPVAAARVPGVSPALSTKSWSKNLHSKKQQKGKPRLHDVHKINENGSASTTLGVFKPFSNTRVWSSLWLQIQCP